MDVSPVLVLRGGEGRQRQLRGDAIVAPCGLFAVATVAETRACIVLQVSGSDYILYGAVIARA